MKTQDLRIQKEVVDTHQTSSAIGNGPRVARRKCPVTVGGGEWASVREVGLVIIIRELLFPVNQPTM